MTTNISLQKPRAIAWSDIDILAQSVEGFDAGRYYDQQDAELVRAAATRWPLLKAVLEERGSSAPADGVVSDRK